MPDPPQPPTAPTDSARSILLPEEVGLLRQGIVPTTDLYKIIISDDSKSCSCLNGDSNLRCCMRVALKTHKFGHVLLDKLFGQYDKRGLLKLRDSCRNCFNHPVSKYIPIYPPTTTTASVNNGQKQQQRANPSSKDFRLVVVFRNLYGTYSFIGRINASKYFSSMPCTTFSDVIT